MRYQWLSLLGFLLLPFFANSQCKFFGKVTGNLENKLIVFYPFNGFSNSMVPQLKSNIPLDSNHEFKFELYLKTPSFITLLIDNNPVWLIVDNSADLCIKIHLDSIRKDTHTNWLQIEGKNSKGNLYFNEYNFNPYTKYISLQNLFSNLSHNKKDLLQRINYIIDSQIEKFDKFYKNSDIDQTFYKIISKNIQALLYLEVLRNPLSNVNIINKLSSHEANRLIDNIIKKCNPLDTMLTRGLQTNIYISECYLIQALKKQHKSSYEQLKDTIIIRDKKKLFVSKSFRHFLNIKNKQLQENLWGMEIYRFLTLFTDWKMEAEVKTFEMLFPKSKWIKYLRPQIDHNTIDTISFISSKEVTFIDSIGKFDNFDSILSLFKGNALLVDLWATWCSPCRQEFDYNKVIDSLLKLKGIKRLYISIDNSFLKDTWKYAIHKYKLSGNHVLASSNLIEDIRRRIYNSNEIFLIPRYILVDRFGKITNKDTPRPSDPELQKLLTKINLNEFQ